jgi:hypothetical protein
MIPASVDELLLKNKSLEEEISRLQRQVLDLSAIQLRPAVQSQVF